jgi:aminoglycoside phosphotransferase (APT) family kinase protein
MTLTAELLPKVQAYVDGRDWSAVPVMGGRRFRVTPLAQGEYNLNFLLRAADLSLVLRVNMGSQIARRDQIAYEYRALQLLHGSGVTPRPYAVDDSRTEFEQGILIMEYLPGEPLDYRRDLAAAARTLAAVHQVAVPARDNHLIRETRPLTLIVTECRQLLQRYFDSERCDPTIRQYLGEVLAWAEAARGQERYYQSDPWPCVVNTEVNSGNFIVQRRRRRCHLVDWEMPRWGDPSQDLAHFCSPLTTLWKSDYRMPAEDRRLFLDHYRAAIADAHLRDTLAERVRLREPFVRLRGISWSAMGWVAYQEGTAAVRNPDTWATLQRYLQLPFIRELFDPVLTH